MKLAAEGISERVHGCSVNGAETETAVKTGAGHALAGFGVVGIADGAWEETCADGDSFERVEVDEWVGEAVGVGLDEMRECVEAGVRGDGARSGVRERGVDEGGRAQGVG